ncbi:MAG: flagellar biosynthesis protein FlhA [Planctomycetia bacterium]|nr:flagellar biosynthesis protein FlhA [Planctomycetia bacterium]
MENRSVGASRTSVEWRKSLVLPVALMATVALILVPMSATVMDLLLSFNLMLSVLILLTAVFIRKPLDFSAFPTILLTVVMLRLGLNIATTRMILTHAEEDGTLAAGAVIEAFSNFVTAGNLVVGMILFLIVLIIQFVVITKGAGRISEVSARFTLDGLPGKQMAIDSELQNGSITAEEARRRRSELGAEVDFFGAMDGASKFVRGDAIAGLGITFINILGGLAIGLTSGNHTLAETVDIYTRLTIGDGLVSQLPAFLVAIGAALLVTRGSRESNLAEDVQSQLLSRPVAMLMTGGILGALALTPLPKVPLLVLAAGCVILAGMMYRDAQKTAENEERERLEEGKLRDMEESRKAAEVRLEEALMQEPIELEIGAGLADWTKSEGDGAGNKPDLLTEIQGVRRTLAREYGFLMPAVRVTAGVGLDRTAYRLRIAGSPVAEMVLRTDSLLALEGVFSTGMVDGLQTRNPFGPQAAVWITPESRNETEEDGYEVLTPCAVLIRHLTEIALQFAPELLTHEDVKNLIDTLAKTSPATVNDVVPDLLGVQEIQRVLGNLLAEQVPIRSLGTILETLARTVSHTRHPIELTEAVRESLGRLIASRNLDADGVLNVITLSPEWESRLMSAFELTSEGIRVFPAPAERTQLVKALKFHQERLALQGERAVLLVLPTLRAAVREIISPELPTLAVLSMTEVPKNTRLKQVEMVEFQEKFQAVGE